MIIELLKKSPFMKRVLIILFLITGFVVKSQTYFQDAVESNIREYLDSLLIKPITKTDQCDCQYTAYYRFYSFVDKEQKEDPELDQIILDEHVDNSLDYITSEIKNWILKRPKEVTNMTFKVDVKRRSIKWSILRFKWKVRYLVTFTIWTNSKTNEKKEN
jgi:tRNA(Ser,Leu) C12 N-acetylase TAN1